MRILFISNRFPRPGHETDATYNGHQVDALAARHQVRAIVPVAWPERLRDGHRGGAGRRCLRGGNVPVEHPTYWFPPRMMETRYGQFFLRSVRPLAIRISAEFRPDVIYASWAHPDGWAAVRLGRELGIPVVIKVIGSDVLVLATNPRRRGVVAEALRQADGVLAVSRDLAEHVCRLDVDHSLVHVVPEGTHLHLFTPADRRLAAARLKLSETGPLTGTAARLLFVGNLLVSKGVGVLLEACAFMRSRGVAFRCHLVGRGKDERRLRDLARQLGLGAEHVDFAGASPQERLADWYRACDLVTLPSFSEGIPNVLREAMACGRRFVATRVGGIPEITRPGVGTLVEPGDAAGLADALVAGLTGGDPAVALAQPLALAASAQLNITWQQSAERVEQNLLDAIRRRCAMNAPPPPTDAARSAIAPGADAGADLQ